MVQDSRYHRSADELDASTGCGRRAIHRRSRSPGNANCSARRRRLAAMVNAAALARSTPTVYAIEDAHWIDGISESMLAEFITVVPRTRSLVLITYRPEYV